MTWFELSRETQWRNYFVMCIHGSGNISHLSFKTINPEGQSQQGVKKFLCSLFLAAEDTTPYWTRMEPRVSSDSLVEGENTLSGEIVFTVCRKLITSNKLISRYCFRINCIFTEVTGSDGSSSSDKSGHKVVYWIMLLISATAFT